MAFNLESTATWVTIENADELAPMLQVCSAYALVSKVILDFAVALPRVGSRG
jgi:hypothetical protein